MTTPFRARRRRGRRIVSVSNHWRFDQGITRREVVVQLPDGGLQRGWMPDEHPEVLAFLAAAAVAA